MLDFAEISHLRNPFKMRNTLCLAALTLMVFPFHVKAQNTSLQELWRSTDHITCESVLFDGKGQRLFVSNIEGNPTEKDGKGSIDILNLDGSVQTKAWVVGLDAPKGSALLADRLYVTNIDELVEIDLESGKILERYPVEGAQFLNDVTADPLTGLVYFSDMATGKLYAFQDRSISVQLENREGINGVHMGPGGWVYFLDKQGVHMTYKGSVKTLNTDITGGDGLVVIGNNEFIVSRWQGELWYVKANYSAPLMNTTEQKIQSADIGYNPATRTLYVPTFFSNGVVAYQLLF